MTYGFDGPSVNRRMVLQLAAASAALAACSPESLGKAKHVAVIGCGIVGASIAYHLALAGAKVTILERSDIATRASRGTFAWINASWAKQPRHYHSFTQKSLTGWKKLEAELDLPVRWGGSLEWFASQERQTLLAEQIAEQARWGEPTKMLDAEAIRSMEPELIFPDDGQAAFSGNDGAVDPVQAAQLLVNKAVALGAKLTTQCNVSAAKPAKDGGTILTTSKGDVAVDHYVIATGADPEAVQQLAGIDLPQRSTSGVIVLTTPMPRLAQRIIVAPGVHIHQRDDGRIVLGEQDGPPKTAAHDERLKDRPNRFPDTAMAQAHAARIISVAAQYLPAIARAEIDDVYIGWRPLPLDGHPVLGAPKDRPQAYLAIMHSGVSLAPLVGEIAAQEIMQGQRADMLDHYRPDRDLKLVKRY